MDHDSGDGGQQFGMPQGLPTDGEIRADFPITKKIAYMNNGAVAPVPVSTIKAVTDFMVKYSFEGPDSQETAEYIASLATELRTRISHLINCDPAEVIFVQSTTEGLNLVANGIRWKKGDSMVVRGGRHEHPANYLPWLQLSQSKGINLADIPIIDESGRFDLAIFEKIVRTKGTRLVTMTHGLYNTGAIMPVEQVGKIARERGILFCIDAAQTAGSIKIDVKKIGCDFMAFPGFKWLCGPLGIGIFYCSKKSAEFLDPQIIGGESATLQGHGTLAEKKNNERSGTGAKKKKGKHTMIKDTISYREMPQRLQAGFRNYPGMAGLEASMRYILRLGLQTIRSKNMKVAGTLREELGKISGVRLVGPEAEDERTSIVAFTVPPGHDPGELVKKLEQNNVIFAERDIGGGRKGIRAAPHFFNSHAEASQAADFIKSFLR